MEVVMDDNELLSCINSIVQHVDATNTDEMILRLVTLPIVDVTFLEKIALVLYFEVLREPFKATVLAQFCGRLIQHPVISCWNKHKILEKTLLLKCRQKYFSYFPIVEEDIQLNDVSIHSYEYLKPYVIVDEYLKRSPRYDFQDMITFIAALHWYGVFQNSEMRSLIQGTIRISSTNILAANCLCLLLKFAGPKLSKNYSLTLLVGHAILLTAVNFPNDDHLMHRLKITVDDVKMQYLSYWIFEDPEKLLKHKLFVCNERSSRNMKVEDKIIDVGIYDQCYSLIFDYVTCWTRVNLDNFRDFLSPTVALMVQQNPVEFITNFVLTALNPSMGPEIRTGAGNILFLMINSGILSTLTVTKGFENVFSIIGSNEKFPEIIKLLMGINFQTFSEIEQFNTWFV